MTGKNSVDSYPIMGDVSQVPQGYVDIWRFMDSADLGVEGVEYCYLYEDGYPANKVNLIRGDRLAFWTTGQDHGFTLCIKLAKVEDAPVGFSSPVAVNNDCSYYDLSGRKVFHPDKGVYLVNGKKVFIK